MPTGDDGRLRPYNSDEIDSWHLGTRGIDDGNNPEEHYSPDGNGCTRLWLCDWADRFDVIKHLVGQTIKYDDSGTAKLSRLKPQSHPTYDQWWCSKASVTGHKFIEDDDADGAGNLIPIWDAAEIVAQYEQVPMRFMPDEEVTSEIQRYVTKPGYIQAEITAVGQYLGMPAGILKFKTSDGSPPHNVPVPFTIGYTECEGRFSAIWRRIPEHEFEPGKPLYDRVHGDPDTDTRPWIGTTNKTPLFGRKIGTCLLEGVEPKLYPDPIGSGYSWDLKWLWFYKPQTHYKLRFWDTDSTIANGYLEVARPAAPYTAIEDLGDDDSLFPLRDHADGLFKIS